MDGDGVNKGYMVVEVLKNFLGKPKSEVDALSKDQWQFNCPTPTCRHDVDKFNLEFNSKKKVFKCWKCEYYGFVYKLTKDYGTQADYDKLKLILPPDKLKKFSKQAAKPRTDHHLVTCKLPEGYMPLGKKRNTNLYNLAWEYFTGHGKKQRKLSLDVIDEYQIGYTESGDRKFRIIIPSKNSLGRFNYYDARSYMKDPKIPYMKPSGEEVHKNDIIFNEYNINWDLPVYLVEGVFDMFQVPNSIPVLGKQASPLLIAQLLKHNPIVILCFDPDAMKKTIETYQELSSLGLNVFFVDLSGHQKDIAKIYEDHGKEEVAKALRCVRKMNLSSQIKNKLKG